MSKEQDYASDSDESDEDFCPENVNDEADSGEEEEDDESESEEEENAESRKKQTKVAKGKNKDTINEKRKSTETEISARSTRQTEAKQNGRETAEKDELESDEEADKSRSDALWADFLGDVGAESKPRASKPKEKQPSPIKQSEKAKITSPVATSEEVTELEEISQEHVSKSSPSSTSSAKENQETSAACSIKTAPPRGAFGATKRPANGGGIGGGGLGSLLNHLGKKKKLSVLEKSQQDWKTFKCDEGIDEELRTHNKGKDGYLERQDFLQRTDLRQFEIEKNMRQTRRQN